MVCNKVTDINIERYIQQREEDGVRPATIDYELAMLRRGFRLAIEKEMIPRMPSIPRFNPKNVRQGFFERHELDALLPHLPDYYRGWVRFAYLTGWRVKSEIFTRQWRHVDMNAGIIRLEPGETKNKKGRTFPFATYPELRTVLEDQRRYTDQVERETGTVIRWVFHRHGTPIKDCRAAWRTACRRAGLVGKIPHDFRRTGCRNLERANVSRSVAMKLVGHETQEIYERYCITNEQDLSEGVAKLAGLAADTTILPITKTSKRA